MNLSSNSLFLSRKLTNRDGNLNTSVPIYTLNDKEEPSVDEYKKTLLLSLKTLW